MTKKEIFRLSQTCKSFMQNPALIGAIFYEPVSVADIGAWYWNLPDFEMNKMVGPPVTWGIDASTGPYVRCLALPEWTSEQDVKHLIAHCPNLDAVDFVEICKSVPDRLFLRPNDDTNQNVNGDGDDEE